jgi:hypothetical protein
MLDVYDDDDDDDEILNLGVELPEDDVGKAAPHGSDLQT